MAAGSEEVARTSGNERRVRPDAVATTSARHGRPRCQSPFIIASAVLLIGLLDTLVGLTVWDVWQWLVAGGLGIAVGLYRIASTLGQRACRAVRNLARLAACGSGLYLTATISFQVADLVGLRLPTPLQGLFIVGALSMLVGLIAATVRVGGAMIRSPAKTSSTGWLFVLIGVLLFSPIPALAGIAVHEAFAPVSVASLAALLGIVAMQVTATNTR